MFALSYFIRNKRANLSGYELNLFEKVLFFIINPYLLKYLINWQDTLKISGKNNHYLPWLTYGAIDWLEKNLKPTMKLFEYGMGSSTLYFSKKVQKVVSVEHNREWFEKTRLELKKNKLINCKLLLKKPRKLNHIPDKYNCTTFEKFKNYTFENYVKSIKAFPNNYFDLVIVDGRARVSCIITSINKIKKVGFIILDNSERKQYDKAKRLLSKYKRLDYFSFGPKLSSFWITTIWKLD